MSFRCSNTPLRLLRSRTLAPTNFVRYASAQTKTEIVTPTTVRRSLQIILLVTSGIVFTAYYLDPRSSVHRYLIPPLLRVAFDAEKSHKLAVKALAGGFAPRDTLPDDPVLETEVWGYRLSSPISLAAGFDKDAEAIKGLFGLGFSWVEIGSVTPKPQPPNPAPRVFRLEDDSAIINRYGFPSGGSALVGSRLRSFISLHRAPYASKILAVNLGKNKTSALDSIDDYLTGVRNLGPFADVLVINVSSPNTPGLRGLQSRDILTRLLSGVIQERDQLPARQADANGIKWARPKIVVKIAPDLSTTDVEGIAEAVRETGVDGVIVSNTTVQRPVSLRSESSKETGGLSGPPLMSLSLTTLRALRTLLPSSTPIFGCGGISSATDAITFAESGATAVQLWTSFAYNGAGTPRRMKDELTAELKKRGLTWMDLVREGQKNAGSALKKPVESIPVEEREAIFLEESDTLMKETLELKALLQQVGSALDLNVNQVLRDSKAVGWPESREVPKGVKGEAESGRQNQNQTHDVAHPKGEIV